MWHNRFSENENEPVEAHIPRHWDSKTKKPRHRGSKTKKPRHRGSKTKQPRHRESETNKPRHRDSKAFFQRTKSHDIEIPRLKNHDIEIPRPKSHDIEFLWNSDPYAHWQMFLIYFLRHFMKYKSENRFSEFSLSWKTLLLNLLPCLINPFLINGVYKSLKENVSITWKQAMWFSYFDKQSSRGVL